MIKIVIDKAIPFIEGVFEPYADVRYIRGEEIVHDDIVDADAIVIRTRTKCNKDLLDGTAVKLIATATIGMDHIDTEYCRGHGIFLKNASGCNAGGVMNYVFSALYGVAARKAIPLEGRTLGIIGVGHVGTRVELMARSLGFNVLRCDPPRAVAEGPDGFCSLEYLLGCSNVVTLHVPLTENTYHMVGEEFFSMMRPGAFFINTARGEIVDEKALKAAVPKLGAVIIDTWDNEPDVDVELLNMVDIATPHIAGYSYQGKQNGTASAVRSVAHFFDFKPLFEFFPTTPLEELEAIKVDLKGKTQGEIASVLQYNYPIFTDDFMFRLSPGSFEKLREEYSYRREYYIEG